MVEKEFPVFDGKIKINGQEVTQGAVEWRPATMKHKMLQALGDEPAKDILLEAFDHPCDVTNEALSVISTLHKPETGFNSLTIMDWKTLNSKVSPTVID